MNVDWQWVWSWNITLVAQQALQCSCLRLNERESVLNSEKSSPTGSCLLLFWLLNLLLNLILNSVASKFKPQCILCIVLKKLLEAIPLCPTVNHLREGGQSHALPVPACCLPAVCLLCTPYWCYVSRCQSSPPADAFGEGSFIPASLPPQQCPVQCVPHRGTQEIFIKRMNTLNN